MFGYWSFFIFCNSINNIIFSMFVSRSFCNSNFCYLPSINIEIMKWTWIIFIFLKSSHRLFPRETPCVVWICAQITLDEIRNHVLQTQNLLKFRWCWDLSLVKKCTHFLACTICPTHFNIQNIKKTLLFYTKDVLPNYKSWSHTISYGLILRQYQWIPMLWCKKGK